ncbi:MAG: hypothetical protein PHT64_06720 [Bacteroidales bacterium]|nr:hypothetical protein [Bacteroidales bacterium]MDD4436253.1 hypothetical protein [Bacteroidales bacterium]MDD5733470.1 hypothetical protein [Bacteroidales bacterium]HOZ19787.1 hypothetical protein [Bacteroidales bacterium]
MSIPDIRLVYMNLVAALLVLIAGILCLLNPENHVVLLALLFIVGGEAAFVTWGMDRVEHRESRPLQFLFYIGIAAMLLALIILFFRPYLELYTIHITAMLLIIVYILQLILAVKIYRTIKNRSSMWLIIISAVLLAATLPFLIYPPFTPDIRATWMAVLSFLCAATILSCFTLARRVVLHPVHK